MSLYRRASLQKGQGRRGLTVGQQPRDVCVSLRNFAAGGAGVVRVDRWAAFAECLQRAVMHKGAAGAPTPVGRPHRRRGGGTGSRRHERVFLYLWRSVARCAHGACQRRPEASARVAAWLQVICKPTGMAWVGGRAAENRRRRGRGANSGRDALHACARTLQDPGTACAAASMHAAAHAPTRAHCHTQSHCAQT
eukprot:357431-Chlamydomonas_euryale.AAC.5